MWIWAAQGGVTHTSTPPWLSSFYITQTHACKFNNINVLTHIQMGRMTKAPLGRRQLIVCVCLMSVTDTLLLILSTKSWVSKETVSRKRKENILSHTDGLFSHLYNTFCTGKTPHIHPPATHTHTPHTHTNLLFLYASVKKTNTGASKNICAVNIAELITH